jgi:hypothetical protein
MTEKQEEEGLGVKVDKIDRPDDAPSVTGRNKYGLLKTEKRGTLLIPTEGVRDKAAVEAIEEAIAQATSATAEEPKKTTRRSKKAKEPAPEQAQPVKAVKANIVIRNVATFPTQYSVICRGTEVYILGILQDISWVPEVAEYDHEDESFTNTFEIEGIEDTLIWAGQEFTLNGQRYLVVVPCDAE